MTFSEGKGGKRKKGKKMGREEGSIPIYSLGLQKGKKSLPPSTGRKRENKT